MNNDHMDLMITKLYAAISKLSTAEECRMFFTGIFTGIKNNNKQTNRQTDKTPQS